MAGRVCSRFKIVGQNVDCLFSIQMASYSIRSKSYLKRLFSFALAYRMDNYSWLRFYKKEGQYGVLVMDHARVDKPILGQSEYTAAINMAYTPVALTPYELLRLGLRRNCYTSAPPPRYWDRGLIKGRPG